jgi:hypothetical protein
VLNTFFVQRLAIKPGFGFFGFDFLIENWQLAIDTFFLNKGFKPLVQKGAFLAILSPLPSFNISRPKTLSILAGSRQLFKVSRTGIFFLSPEKENPVRTGVRTRKTKPGFCPEKSFVEPGFGFFGFGFLIENWQLAIKS